MPRLCQDCGQPLREIHPEAEYHLRWGHISLDDAANCRSGDRPSGAPWPLPKE